MQGFPETFELTRVPAAWRGLFDGDVPWALLDRLDALFAAWPEGPFERGRGEVDPALDGFEQIDARDYGAARVLFFKLTG